MKKLNIPNAPNNNNNNNNKIGEIKNKNKNEICHMVIFTWY